MLAPLPACRKWEAEQQKNYADGGPEPGTSYVSTDGLEALEYTQACGVGTHMQFLNSAGRLGRSQSGGPGALARAVSGMSMGLQDMEASLHSLGGLSEEVSPGNSTHGGALLRRGSGSVHGGTALRGSGGRGAPLPDATAGVLRVASKARDLLQKQEAIEEAAAALWEASVSASEAWAGRELVPVQIDLWGRYPYVVIRVSDGPGHHQRFLVRGRNGVAQLASLEEVQRQVRADAGLGRDPDGFSGRGRGGESGSAQEDLGAMFTCVGSHCGGWAFVSLLAGWLCQQGEHGPEGGLPAIWQHSLCCYLWLHGLQVCSLVQLTPSLPVCLPAGGGRAAQAAATSRDGGAGGAGHHGVAGGHGSPPAHLLRPRLPDPPPRCSRHGGWRWLVDQGPHAGLGGARCLPGAPGAALPLPDQHQQRRRRALWRRHQRRRRARGPPLLIMAAGTPPYRRPLAVAALVVFFRIALNGPHFATYSLPPFSTSRLFPAVAQNNERSEMNRFACDGVRVHERPAL